MKQPEYRDDDCDARMEDTQGARHRDEKGDSVRKSLEKITTPSRDSLSIIYKVIQKSRQKILISIIDTFSF